MNLILNLCNLIVFSLSVSQVICLFEDQVGKFDWKVSLVGFVKYARLVDQDSSKKLFVASEDNVLAALDVKSGELVWRQILEKGSQGIIRLLSTDADIVVSITGISNPQVRGWNADYGFLNFQWSLPTPVVTNFKEAFWWVHQGKLYQAVLFTNSRIEVMSFSLRSGAKAKPPSTIPAAWISESSSCNCALSNGFLLCASKSGTLHSIHLLDAEQVAVTKSLPSSNSHTLKAVEGSPIPAFIATDSVMNTKTLITVNTKSITINSAQIPSRSDMSINQHSNGKHAVISVRQQEKSLLVSGFILETGLELSELSAKVEVPTVFSGVSIAASHCIMKRDKTILCDLLIRTDDNTLVFFTIRNSGSETVSWFREEALAGIISVQLIDLGVSEEDAAIEKEFNNKESSFFGMFYRRISSQLNQLHSFILTSASMLDQPYEVEKTAQFVRDEFGLHKIIVAVTKLGKVFGIDNLTGNILWTLMVPDVVPFSLLNKVPTVPFFVQRTARHFPFPAQCTVIFQDPITSNGVLFSFNPISGQPLGQGVVRLPYKIQQVMLLHLGNDEFLNGILLVDTQNRVHVYPESCLQTAIASAPNTYLFLAFPSTGLLTGYALHHTGKNYLIAKPIWEVNVGRDIISIEPKNPQEKVHSQGRVLGDRSVLYKYINPNLIAVTTHHQDPVHKSVINLWLIDAVSGAVAYATSHKRATPPVHVVHSENWVVYSYFNEKFRRTEIGALELYEGKTQRNTTAFTAAGAALIFPFVGKQAYILPASVETMRETITEKGITSKNVLVALSSGGILEIPWPFLDPRRPVTVTPEMREEGVIPYMPELPILAEGIINYNQTMLRVRGIHTTPSGLESTCLVFIYGLDIFYTRISPSKTFDLLKDDFDYFLILIVLSALSIAAYMTKHLASRKALKQAWK